MKSNDRHERATSLILEAGARIQSQFGKHKRTQKKRDHDFVTEVDLAIEEWYRAEILSAFPDDSIIGEEGGSHQGSSGYTWIVDPLDGTNNFARAFPIYGSIIAIMKDQEVIAGYIILPEQAELYTAQKGRGAYWYRVADGVPSQERQLKVSERTVDDAMFMHSYFTQHDKYLEELPFITRLHQKMPNARGFFCAAYNYAALSSGKAEEEFAPQNNPWDVAAGCLIVEEAGGRVSTYDGLPVTDYHGSIVATNGIVHDAVLSVIAESDSTGHHS